MSSLCLGMLRDISGVMVFGINHWKVDVLPGWASLSPSLNLHPGLGPTLREAPKGLPVLVFPPHSLNPHSGLEPISRESPEDLPVADSCLCFAIGFVFCLCFVIDFMVSSQRFGEITFFRGERACIFDVYWSTIKNAMSRKALEPRYLYPFYFCSMVQISYYPRFELNECCTKFDVFFGAKFKSIWLPSPISQKLLGFRPRGQKGEGFSKGGVNFGRGIRWWSQICEIPLLAPTNCKLWIFWLANLPNVGPLCWCFIRRFRVLRSVRGVPVFLAGN